MTLRDNIKKERQKWNVKQKLRSLFQCITIEPIFILYMLAMFMSSVTHQNLILEKSCRVNLKLPVTVCDALTNRNISGFTPGDEITVQKLVAQSYIWRTVIQSVFPTVLLVMLGSWSDRNKCRKVLMVLPCVGQIISNLGLLMSTYFFNGISMELTVLIDILPAALTGLNGLMLAGIFSYVSETTPGDKKTWKIGLIHIMMNISCTTGIALSGAVYRWVGFYGVFTAAAIMYLCSALYGVYFVTEVTEFDETKAFHFVKDLFDIKKTLREYKFITKKENADKVKQLLLIIVVAILNLGPTVGENAVLYLYTRHKFHWDELNFSAFYTYFSVLHLLGNTIALWVCSKYFKMEDALLGGLSILSRISGFIVYSLAKNPVIFYLGTLADVFQGIAFIASRSIVSKIIPPNELGRANSLFGIAESLTPFIYGPLYSGLYKATLEKFPGSFFVLGILILIPAGAIYIWMYFYYQKKNTKDDVTFVEANKEKLLSSNIITET